MSRRNEDAVRLPLDKAAEHMLEECRMVLPGIQALFGFQLIAVFSERFNDALDLSGKRLHLAAIVMIVVAIALIMTPAALQRVAEPRAVSDSYLMLCSRLILAAMVPLALAIALETWLVAKALLGDPAVAWSVAIALGLLFFLLWGVFPYRRRLKR